MLNLTCHGPSSLISLLRQTRGASLILCALTPGRFTIGMGFSTTHSLSALDSSFWSRLPQFAALKSFTLPVDQDMYGPRAPVHGAREQDVTDSDTGWYVPGRAARAHSTSSHEKVLNVMLKDGACCQLTVN